MKDSKGHGSNKRGGKLPPGTTAAYAGRDHLGRTYTQAIRDYDRFRSQNPVFPDAEDYRTDKSSNAEAAEALANSLKSTQAPIHPAMNSAGHAYGSPEAIKDFTDQYGKPRDHAAEQRSFNSGKREIARLQRKGK
jgi:hypothetical protein